MGNRFHNTEYFMSTSTTDRNSSIQVIDRLRALLDALAA
jgi:hypothetical protein